MAGLRGGSLGAASVLAVVLNPVLASALAGPPSLAELIAVAYPWFDLLLVAVVVGMVAVLGLRGRDRITLLLAGLMLYASADVIYALQVTANPLVTSSPLDATWTIGITLIAVYADGSAQREGSPGRVASPAAYSADAPAGAASLVMPAVATAAGLGVLLVSSRVHLRRYLWF